MPAPPKRYKIYRWKRLPFAKQLRLFNSVTINAIFAQMLLRHRFIVEDDSLPTRFGDGNITIFGDSGLWYFPRELVVEVKDSPRQPRKRHARPT